MNPGSQKSDNSAGSGREISLLEFYSILAGRKFTIAALLAIGMVVAAIYSFTSAPTYEATVRVLIDQKARRGAEPFRDPELDNAVTKVTNELETLRSLSVSGAVADSLMARRYLDDSLKTVLPLLASVEKAAAGKPYLRQYLLEALQRSMDFTPIKESDVIRVTARSHNPVEAALLANIYTHVYTEHDLWVARSRSKAAREFLQEQLAEKHHALESVENQLKSYMQSSGIVALDIDSRKVVEQLAQLEANKDALDMDIQSRMQTLQSYKDELAKLGPTVARSIGESGDTYIKLLQDQLAKLEVERDLARAQNPDIASRSETSQQFKNVEGQIAELRQRLRERTASFIESAVPSNAHGGAQEGFTGFLGELKQKVIEHQVEIDGMNARRETLVRVMKDYERQFNQIPGKSIYFARLERSKLSNEKLYLMVEQKYNELAISESSQIGTVIVMDEALIPLSPVRPILLLNLLVGAFIGLASGVLLVIVQSLFELRIFGGEDLRKRGYPILSTVGKIDVKSLQQAPQHRRSGFQPASPLDIHLVVWNFPLHPVSESYRHLYTSLRHLQGHAAHFAVVVTSPNPGEGKSTTAANLAVAAAEGNRKILLIDADLRRPTQHHLWGLENKAGFADFLLHRPSYRALLHENVLPNLDVITCGAPLENPAAALASDRVEELIGETRDEYDLVVIDAPPLLAVSDASVVAAHTDGSVVVVSAAKTTVPSLEGGVESLRRVGSTVLGFVLNNYDVRRLQQYRHRDVGYGYYGYGYSHHSGNGQHKETTITR